MKFISTETLSKSGQLGEQFVIDSIQGAFATRESIGYWRYPIFSTKGKVRKEPDILIADFELGLIIIEVKSITIDKIVSIQGHRWEYCNFYTQFGNPYQQAENQLLALLEYIDSEPQLKHQITARALISLPLITQEQWQQRDFDKLPHNPPILFKNYLLSSTIICQFLAQLKPLNNGEALTQQKWQLLLSILSGKSVFCRPNHRVLSHPYSRGKVLQKLRSHSYDFDLQQETIGKQIPPGLQRIRGIAGSGKTVILCQKAAIMHLKYPQWKIALVFFSRSLYENIIQQIDKWLRYFSNNQQCYNPKDSQLLILHAWGSKKQPGLYSTIAKITGIVPLNVNDTINQKPNEALAEVCWQLLQNKAIPQVFDAILIDEGQDLIVDRYKFDNKQPFYWLAYQSLRPVYSLNKEQKILIWAYDEIQSLESLKIPNTSELFGESLGYLTTGFHSNGIRKSEIMHRCYRTPHQIIAAAHAISMGLLRRGGMLTGITRKNEWEALGYEVQGRFVAGEKVTIKRPRQNSPNPIPELWQGAVIQFHTYSSRQQELSALARQIKYNLKQDGLRPSREILVIVLGSFFEAFRLENYVAQFLKRQGIDIYIPSSERCNLLPTDSERKNLNQFWYEGAVTVSRIHRAKGHEADMIYVIGLDKVAEDESNIYLRNQLFVALTRARGWVNISGIGDYSLYDEMRQVIDSGDTFTFLFSRPPKREINATDGADILKRYSLGGRNFVNVDLQEAQLVGVCLKNANLIGANLRSCNLQYALLDGVKLIAADLSYANLKGASLRRAKLMGANLTGVNLRDADLTGADLTNADLTDAKLEGTISSGKL